MMAQAITGYSNSIGGTTYYNFSDGTSGYSNYIGDTTYFNFSDGTSGTATNIGGTIYYNYNTFNYDGALNKYSLNLSSNEKIIMFEDADEKKDFQVFLTLNNAKNEQCKFQTIKNYNDFKNILKDIALEGIKKQFGTKSATEEIADCKERMGIIGSSPSVAISCLQLAISQRNSYLESINNIYKQSLDMANIAKIYNDCVNTGCADGYEWNKEKTLCIKKSVVVQDIKSQSNDGTVNNEKKLLTAIDNNLTKRISGKILLQVEKNGEGWYVYPDDKKKYYLGRPADAFSIMRNLGLGIKHSELNNYLNAKFPSRLSGKIMLDVEQNGEAYYVNPDDLKGYYLSRPVDAFRIMRELGLGITNNDIRKIDVGEIN